MIVVTDRAATAVEQADAAARRFNRRVRIRLARAGTGVRFEFTDEPAADDLTVPCGSATLYVEAGLEGTLDTGDHNAPVLTD